MADVMTVEKRSQLMARIRGQNTKPERYIDELLQAAGLKYDRHANDLLGKPDFVFREDKIIVFVDGDFWHGWRFPVWEHRLSEFWRDKIAKNRARDCRNHHRLRAEGWRVLRIWEHQVEEDVIGCIKKIVSTISDRAVNWKAVEEMYAELPPLRRRNRLPKP